jgi:hypothetical protein
MLKNVPCKLYLVGRVVFKAPKRNSLEKKLNGISLPWALALSYLTTSFASLTGKPAGPCEYIN